MEKDITITITIKIRVYEYEYEYMSGLERLEEGEARRGEERAICD